MNFTDFEKPIIDYKSKIFMYMYTKSSTKSAQNYLFIVDLLSPTLAASVFGEVSIREADDTESVRGELSFVPKYPYYNNDTPTDSEWKMFMTTFRGILVETFFIMRQQVVIYRLTAQSRMTFSRICDVASMFMREPVLR